LADDAFLLALPEALRAAELLDADSDGFTNIEELMAGSSPAELSSVPVYPGCDPVETSQAANQRYNVCGYDHAYAYRKMMLDFCGAAPSLPELEVVAASATPSALIHEKLSECLDSDHWRGVEGVLWSLAHTKVQPAASLKSGEDAGDIPLADYVDDYNLFVYATTDDRDVRELLRANYFVERTDSGELVPFVRTPQEDIAARGTGLAQLVAVDRRAGMLTSRWFLMSNTMFTSVPRTTAAQAYRAFLGFDIANMEGLHSVSGEPVDYDARSVDRPECANCHATLDPLTYPFSRYEGIGGGDDIFKDGKLNFIPFSYNAARLDRFVEEDGEDVVLTPESGVIFGTEVQDLLEWAEVATNSEPFARKIVEDFWELLMGEPPRPSELQEFSGLWRDLMTTHQYRVEAMLHALVDTEAYGVP
jgi:hypothetical protein